MQTEVGLFIFHVSLPGSCLLQVSVSPSFFYIFFLFGGGGGICLDHLLKGQCTSPPCTFCRMRLLFFLFGCFIDINYINLWWREMFRSDMPAF